MADTKITALTALTAADPANDVIPIVDVSDTTMAASGTTKKISVNNILGASGTATLASATITGDLTVDTSTLKVDSTNDRVGIGTASPAYPLSVAGRISYASAIGEGPDTTVSSSGTSLLFGNSATWSENQFYANGNLQYRIQSAGIFTWTDGAGGTRMTLNATGLGVGMSPVSAFNVGATGGNDGDLYFNTLIRNTGTAATSQPRTGILFSGYYIGSTNFSNFAGITGGKENATSGNSAGFISLCTAANGGSPTARLTVDSSGNVGIGVTPSAWNSDYKPIDIGANGCIAGRVGNSNTLDIISNGFRNAAGNYVYKSAVSAPAARYLLDGSTGSHIWFSGVAGTAGNTIVGFTTAAMTLDASGNLLVGTTDATQTSGVGTKILGSGLGPYVVNPAIANSALAYTMYSTGAAAYRFYVGWAGTVFATNTTISAISDARLKENVQDLDVGLNAILALKPRKFDWKEGKGKNIKGDRGFIAQEFETVFPNLIDEWADPAPEGEAPYKSVRQDLIPVLVKAIQELTARVQTLETR